MLAAIRPPGQDFPVLLHIVGATIVFGALLASNVKDVDWLTIGFVVGDYGGPQRLVVGTVFRPGRPLRLAMQACVDQSEMPRLWRIYELCAPVRPSTRSGSR